jgi:hypothetical protein
MVVPYTVKHLYHSTHFVPSLPGATKFFETVFERTTVPLRDYLGHGDREPDPRYASDYAVFTEIADVLVECIDPTRHLIDGVAPHAPVEQPHPETLAWFIEGPDELWAELRRRGIRGVDMKGREPEGEGPPLEPVGSTPMIFTMAADTGLSYELCPYLPHRDPRGDPPVPAVSESDPLGIDRCSHHTVLTDRPERALPLLVDVLGGRVIHEARNDVLATQSTYIALADGTVELATPLEDGTPAMDDWRRHAPGDSYYSIAWQVRDLVRAAARLDAHGVKIASRTDTAFVTDAADGLGVPWVFTTTGVPNDPRG